MKEKINRRDFLKLSMFGIGSLAFRPLMGWSDDSEGMELARVAIKSVSVYSKPSDKSTILYQRTRDELINIYYEVISEDGPGYNPLWYRVWRGYVHSAHLQRVKVHLNPVASSISDKTGQLAEITVPFSQPLRYLGYKKEWEPVHRLYYGSTHWVVGIEEGPDGTPWYRLHDELNEAQYHAPATHLRMIAKEEFAPISPDVDPWKKRIEVSIARQELVAYENNVEVLRTSVATGVPDHRKIPGLIPTDTPKGEYHVYSKMPSKHMGDGSLSADPDAYEIPGVPWTTFFADHGVALHGTYWHTNWGIPMSHGCVNLRTEHAKWLFRWTTPVAEAASWETRGYGTLVVVS
jgi:hypothetical protein